VGSYFCIRRATSVITVIIHVPNPNPFRDSLRSLQHFMKAHHVKKQPAKLGGQGSSRFLNIGNSIDALNSGREGTSSPLVLMSPSRISPPPPVENVLLGTAGAAEGGGGGGGEGAAVTALTGVADAAGSAGTTLLATAAAAAGEVAKGASVPVPSQKDFFADVQEQVRQDDDKRQQTAAGRGRRRAKLAVKMSNVAQTAN